MMSQIRGRDTKAEVAIRKRLFKMGYRYRTQVRDLPGRPDIVLPKHRVVVFVNGCFWHYHACYLSKTPSTRTEWWEAKLRANQDRDRENLSRLKTKGWRIVVIWECYFRGKGKSRSEWLDKAARRTADFIVHGKRFLQLKG